MEAAAGSSSQLIAAKIFCNTTRSIPPPARLARYQNDLLHGETLPVAVLTGRDGNVWELIEGILLPEEFEDKIKPLLRQAARERVRLG